MQLEGVESGQSCAVISTTERAKLGTFAPAPRGAPLPSGALPAALGSPRSALRPGGLTSCGHELEVDSSALWSLGSGHFHPAVRFYHGLSTPRPGPVLPAVSRLDVPLFIQSSVDGPLGVFVPFGCRVHCRSEHSSAEISSPWVDRYRPRRGIAAPSGHFVVHCLRNRQRTSRWADPPPRPRLSSRPVTPRTRPCAPQVNVGAGSHPNKVKVYGPGVAKTGLKAHEPTYFTVDCTEAGQGKSLPRE